MANKGKRRLSRTFCFRHWKRHISKHKRNTYRHGTIEPSSDINVSTLYTYPCVGTGGHTESIELYESGKPIASGMWNGYQGDRHNVTITPQVTLLAGHTYNYTIVTGSYLQIIHAESKDVTGGGTITCDQFIDTNGKTYTDWIPAIQLE